MMICVVRCKVGKFVGQLKKSSLIHHHQYTVMFRSSVRRVVTQSFTRNTQQKRFQSSKRFFEQLGDRPKYFEQAGENVKGKVLPFLALIFVVPMVIIPLYTDWWIQSDIKNGDPLLKEFEEHRKERNARLAEKHGRVVTSPIDNSEEEEGDIEAVTAPLDNKAQTNVEHYKYVLIGGGTSSYCAYKAIRENDPEGTILILTDENYSPYQRPPLSKELWQSSDKDAESLLYTAWNGKNTHVEYEPLSSYSTKNVTLKTNSKVTELDVINQQVVLSNGQVFKYDKCLLGTGGTPRELPGSETVTDRITTFRQIDDFKKVHELSKQGANVVVVGGSFLGTELAYALASHKVQQRQNKNKDVGNVTQVYLEPEVLARNLPRYLSEAVRHSLQSVGVNLKPNRNVVKVSLQKRGVPDSTSANNRVEKVIVSLDNGEEIEADFVITATGIFPNNDLAENAGLEIDPINGGIVTNSELEARQNVFVAGDVLSYYDVVLGRRRIEHYEHAAATGRHAGLNMSSEHMKPFRHVSMFWSDVGKSVSFQAVGEIKSELDTYGTWDGVAVSQNGTAWSNAPAPMRNESFRKGIVYYMKDKKVVGILLWNVSGANVMREARRIILQKKQYHDLSELKDLIDFKKSQ
jgi:programmed cell death 8 (apoptosis-inducing factor)